MSDPPAAVERLEQLLEERSLEPLAAEQLLRKVEELVSPAKTFASHASEDREELLTILEQLKEEIAELELERVRHARENVALVNARRVHEEPPEDGNEGGRSRSSRRRSSERRQGGAGVV